MRSESRSACAAELCIDALVDTISWKKLAEIKVQKVNKMVSATDRNIMHLRAMGAGTAYRDRAPSGAK
jgi:hypothetical protein